MQHKTGLYWFIPTRLIIKLNGVITKSTIRLYDKNAESWHCWKIVGLPQDRWGYVVRGTVPRYFKRVVLPDV